MGKKFDLSLECQKFVKKLFAFFSKVKAKKKEGVFPIAWSSKLGSVGQDFFFLAHPVHQKVSRFFVPRYIGVEFSLIQSSCRSLRNLKS
jgi:hypothetical protein